MKQIIICTILSLVLLAFYPFTADLVWVPARDFEAAYQSIHADQKSKPKYKLQIVLNDVTSGEVDSGEIKNPHRIIELLHESGMFFKKSNTNKPYLKVNLALSQKAFSSELSFKELKSNMPAQLAVNLLMTQGLLPQIEMK